VKPLRLLLFLAALGLAIGIILHLGPERIWANIRLAGWGILLVFLVGFPRFLLYTLSWRVFLPKKAYSLGRLYQIKIAGELITRSTPAHFVGGDTARVLLMGKNLPRKVQAGSVIMDRTVMTLGAAVMVLLGLLIGSFRLPLPWPPKLALWVLVGSLFWGLSFIISHQKRSALVSLLKLIDRIGHWIPDRWKGRAAEVDLIIRGYYDEGHGKPTKAVVYNVFSRILAAMEIYIFMLFLQIPLGPLDAILFASLALLITVAFFFFPGNLGVNEGAYGLLFFFLGLDPATGVSLELLRKANSILWVAAGGVVALTFRFKRQIPLAKMKTIEEKDS